MSKQGDSAKKTLLPTRKGKGTNGPKGMDCIWLRIEKKCCAKEKKKWRANQSREPPFKVGSEDGNKHALTSVGQGTGMVGKRSGEKGCLGDEERKRSAEKKERRGK